MIILIFFFVLISFYNFILTPFFTCFDCFFEMISRVFIFQITFISFTILPFFTFSFDILVRFTCQCVCLSVRVSAYPSVSVVYVLLVTYFISSFFLSFFLSFLHFLLIFLLHFDSSISFFIFLLHFSFYSPS